MTEQAAIWSDIDTVMETITELSDEIKDDGSPLSQLADQAMDLVNLVGMVQRTTEEN